MGVVTLKFLARFARALSFKRTPLLKFLDPPLESPQETAFVESKELLLSSQVLVHFNPSWKFA